MGCFHQWMSRKSPLASVRQSTLASASIASPFLIVIYFRLSPVAVLFFFHPFHHHLSPHGQILTRRSRRPGSPFRASILYSRLLPVCLSVRRVEKKKKAVPPSVNKCLISRLLVPVCLSVCLACRQLSRHSGVAVSQVLVSVLLSVHLPVRASQIRCVNLAPVFFFPFFIHGFCFFFSLPFFSRFSRTGFVKQSASRKHAVFTQSSKLIVAS